MAAAVVQQHATRLKDVATTVVGKEFGHDDNTQLIPVLCDDKIAVERCQVIGITVRASAAGGSRKNQKGKQATVLRMTADPACMTPGASNIFADHLQKGVLEFAQQPEVGIGTWRRQQEKEGSFLSAVGLVRVTVDFRVETCKSWGTGGVFIDPFSWKQNGLPRIHIRVDAARGETPEDTLKRALIQGQVGAFGLTRGVRQLEVRQLAEGTDQKSRRWKECLLQGVSGGGCQGHSPSQWLRERAVCQESSWGPELLRHFKADVHVDQDMKLIYLFGGGNAAEAVWASLALQNQPPVRTAQINSREVILQADAGIKAYCCQRLSQQQEHPRSSCLLGTLLSQRRKERPSSRTLGSPYRLCWGRATSP